MMVRFIPYLLKTLWRHRTRSLLTISGSAVAIFVFSVILSVHDGLAQLTQQGDSVLITFQKHKFCPATSHLPQDYEQAIRKVAGVRDVAPDSGLHEQLPGQPRRNRILRDGGEAGTADAGLHARGRQLGGV